MNFDKLIESVRFENVTVFIGSGFSLKAGAPSSSEIVKCFYKHMSEDEYKYVNDDHLSNVSNEFELMYGREKMIEILQEAMKFIPGDLSDQENLVSIPHFKTIITTNYDTLLEDTYGESNCYVVRTTQDCTEIPNDKTVIFKIHGDFKAKENILVTKNDYEQSFKGEKEKLLWNVIKSQFLTKDILFIGYSLDDGNIFDIITEINKYTNTHRNYFLIAPSLVRHKRNRLEKAGVIYYDAKAEDFFKALFESLNKKIHKDFLHKNVSSSTYSKYCNNHDINPVYSEGKNYNTVERFDALGIVKTNFSCSFNQNFTKMIENKELPLLFTEKIPDMPFPAFKIDRDYITSLSIIKNGITIGDEDSVQEIYIAPSYTKYNATVKIESMNFYEKCQCFVARNINGLSLVKIEQDSFSLTLKAKKQINNTVLWDCSLLFNEKYNDNNNASKWIDLPIAMANNDTININIFSNNDKETMTFKLGKKDKSYMKEFKYIKQYYNNINTIEKIYNLCFTEYNHVTDDSYIISVFLAYGEKDDFTKVIVKQGDYFEFNTDSTQYNNDDYLIDKRKYCLVSVTKGIKCLVLNGRNFNYKFEYTFIPNIHKYIKTITSDGNIRYTLNDKNDCVYKKFSNKKITEYKLFEKLSGKINF